MQLTGEITKEGSARLQLSADNSNPELGIIQSAAVAGHHSPPCEVQPEDLDTSVECGYNLVRSGGNKVVIMY